MYKYQPFFNFTDTIYLNWIYLLYPKNKLGVTTWKKMISAKYNY